MGQSTGKPVVVVRVKGGQKMSVNHMYNSVSIEHPSGLGVKTIT